MDALLGTLFVYTLVTCSWSLFRNPFNTKKKRSQKW